MNPKEIRAKLAALGTELDELRQLDTLTDEQDRRVDAIVNEINDLGEKLVRATNIEAASKNAGEAAEFVRKQGESRGRVSGIQPPGDAPQPGADTRSLGERIADSDEIRRLQNVNGEGVASFSLKSFHNEREQRALSTVAGLPTNYLEPMRIPGISRPEDTFGSLRDVLNVGTTNADALIYFEEDTFTNNAAEVAEAKTTEYAGSGDGLVGYKPESAITFTEKTSGVVTIAHWIPITRQLIWNAPELQSYIEGRLIDNLKLREDAQLLNGNGAAPNLKGLLNTSNVQVLDNTYFGNNPVKNVGEANELFDRILRAKTMIATQGRSRANFVVLNPEDHETFMATTDGQRQYFGAGPFAAGLVPNLWGMRVVINEHISAGTALVGDGRQATIWDRMQAQVLIGTIDKQFVRNMLTLLAEERVGLTVFRPKAFAKVTLAVTAPPEP